MRAEPKNFVPMPRKFAFAANEEIGELQLGGFDRSSTVEDMQMFPMAGFAYGVNVTSIKFGGLELLDFDAGHDAYVGEFDSGRGTIKDPNGSVVVEISKSGAAVNNAGRSFCVVEGFDFGQMATVAAYFLLVDRKFAR